MLTPGQIKTFVEANPTLVTVKQSKNYPELRVVKYSNRVFYDNLWTPELEEMRGLVIDQYWNPVVVPFKKIYNQHERGTDFYCDAHVVAVRKVNGFMAAATYTDEYGVLVSTTGSLDSNYVQFAKDKIPEEFIQRLELERPTGLTYLFEIVHEQDPHIIKENPGAWLLGCREHRSGYLSYRPHNAYGTCGLNFPEVTYWNRFKDLVKHVKEVQHEGFVVYNDKRQALKLKSPHYLITKFFGRKSEDKLNHILTSHNTLAHVEEEFFPLVNHLREVKDSFIALDEQGRFRYIEEFLRNGT